jgi:hypothetical protein
MELARHSYPARAANCLNADHVGDFDAFKCCRGCTEGFEPLHMPSQLLDETMILLNYVV